MGFDWKNRTFNDLWNMTGNDPGIEHLTIDQLHTRLITQATALQLMGERLQRVEDTCRYLMEVHYYYENLGKDKTAESELEN